MKTTLPLLLAFIAGSAAAAPDKLADDSRVQQALGLLAIWADAEAAYKDIPGVSMAVVHDQEILWARGFGDADRAQKTPATPETIYSICSISKLFTSIGVLQLRDQGKLQLDDPLAKYLPWLDIQQTYPDAPPITVRGILTHSSGLPRESDHAYWTYPDYAFPTREEMIDHLSLQKTLYPEGRYFQYSNLGLTLAGELAAAVSGQPYEFYAREHILDPLGMRDTTTEIPKEQRGGRLAMGYGGKRREGEREPLPLFQVRGIAPAAGYASTVLDLAKFASWQFRLLAKGGSDEVLKASTLREMQRVQWVDPDWKTTWGLGFSITRRGDKTFVGHGGSCPGFRSNLVLQTEEKFAAISMMNASDADAGAFTQTAHRIVAPAVAEALASSTGTAPDPALQLYVGTYSGAWGGEIAVFPWKDSLALLYLPTSDPMEALEPIRKTGEHTFRRIRKDDGELAEEIVFTVANGRATRFTRHNNPVPRMN